MANDFIYNLRAARAGQNSNTIPNRLPTRRDLQQSISERRAAEIDSLTPRILGIQVEGDPRFIDRMSPDEGQKRFGQRLNDWQTARQKTLFVDQNAQTANMDEDDRFKWFFNKDVFDNYDNLMQVIDAYDSANNSRESKHKALSDWASKIGGDSEPINYWFALFDYWNDMAYDTGDSPNMVSNMMRRIINNTRNNLYRKV